MRQAALPCSFAIGLAIITSSALLSPLSSCTVGGPSGPASITLKGIVPQGTPGLRSLAPPVKGRGAAGRSISSAIGASVAGFEIIAGSIQGDTPTADAPIGPDGSFSLSLPYEPSTAKVRLGKGYVLLITNPGATSLGGKVSGIIAVNDGTYHIVDMPTDAAKGNIDFGQLVRNADEAQSSLSLGNSQYFDLSGSQMSELGRIGNVFKDARNLYVNFNQETGIWYSAETAFGWGIPGTVAAGTFSDPSSYAFQGHHITFRTNNNASPSFMEVATAAIILSIQPPGPIQVNGHAYDSNIPITNAGAHLTTSSSDGTQAYAGDADFSGRFSLTQGQIMYVIGEGYGIKDLQMPAGSWHIKAGSAELADFDLSSADPFDDSGNFLFYVPEIRISVDSGNYISKVEVSWSSYDKATSSYLPLQDLSVFKALVSNLHFSLTDWSGYSGNGNQRLDEGWSDSTTITQFANHWKYKGDASLSDPVAEGFMVGYAIGNVSFAFGSN